MSNSENVTRAELVSEAMAEIKEQSPETAANAPETVDILAGDKVVLRQQWKVGE